MSSRITIILLIVILFAIPSAYGQGPRIGVKAGFNYTDLYGDAVGSSEPLLRLCIGTFASFPISDILKFQPEFLYTQKGTAWEVYDPIRARVSRTWVKLSYAEISVLTKILLTAKRNWRPHLFIGPYLSVNLAAKGRIKQDGMMERMIIGDVNDIDLGAIFGAGMDIGLGKGDVVFDARYVLGLTGIDEDGEDVKNKVFCFMLGYSLRL